MIAPATMRKIAAAYVMPTKVPLGAAAQTANSSAAWPPSQKETPRWGAGRLGYREERYVFFRGIRSRVFSGSGRHAPPRRCGQSGLSEADCDQKDRCAPVAGESADGEAGDGGEGCEGVVEPGVGAERDVAGRLG